MYHSDYQKSLQQEQRFERHLQTKYKLLTENSQGRGYYPAYDISSTAVSHNNRVIKWEVKYCGTENIFIENGQIIDKVLQPSGLMTTDSDYYVITFNDSQDFHIIPVKKLKEILADKKAKKNIIYDKNGYQLQIFTKEYLLQFCKSI